MICKTADTLLPLWNPLGNTGCPVDYCKQLMDTARKESCGQCVFCREGTWQVYEIIKDITEGNPESGDYELLLDILDQIGGGASCEMAREAAARCLDSLKEDEEEWDKHIKRKRCANLVCRCSYTFYIDPQNCDGCGICIRECPDGVISGGEAMIHIIHTDHPKYNLLSAAVCPRDAIKKAGPVKPKLPAEPVPVGSFAKEAGGEEGETTRRRRRRG
ncbi:MAG: NADH-ubiquinone oxidoreductase-F iron-sulfur binding region domain-containing protein [Lachnospiraceae bacterium]